MLPRMASIRRMDGGDLVNRPDEREIAHIRLLATDMVSARPLFAGPVLGRPQLGVDPVEPP